MKRRTVDGPIYFLTGIKILLQDMYLRTVDRLVCLQKGIKTDNMKLRTVDMTICFLTRIKMRLQVLKLRMVLRPIRLLKEIIQYVKHKKKYKLREMLIRYTIP